MRKRPFGALDLQVSELGLGTWGLSGDGYGPVRDTEQDRVIERALAMGIRLFDTADSYAEGAMESRLGRLLPGDAVIVTKLGTRRDAKPARKDFSATYLREAFERSRERLRRETVDVVLLHNPSAKALQDTETIALLEEIRGRGQIRAWGVSAGNEEIARLALSAGAGVLCLAFNLFHSRELQNLEGELLAKNAAVIGRSVLSHGLLCGLWPQGKEFPEGDHRADRWTADELKRRIYQLHAVRPMVAENVTTLRAAAVRFALSQERLSSVLLGPRNALQLDQLVREAGQGPPYLPDYALSSLRERLGTVGVQT